MCAFIIKSNDTLPYLEATLSDDNGVVDLTGATVTFVMRERNGAAAVVRAAASIVEADEGTVRYEWAEGDTVDAGQYRGEFEISIGGKVLTYPSETYIPINIVADLG
jgi:hypothetical protein